jgi:hypothetical protein
VVFVVAEPDVAAFVLPAQVDVLALVIGVCLSASSLCAWAVPRPVNRLIISSLYMFLIVIGWSFFKRFLGIQAA